jgi:enoyl-[acyl-carrier protein] reductase I
MLREAVAESPVHDLVDIDDVGMATAFLATPFARRLTGSTFYIDAGLNIMS